MTAGPLMSARTLISPGATYFNVVIPDLIRNPFILIWIPAFAGMTEGKGNDGSRIIGKPLLRRNSNRRQHALSNPLNPTDEIGKMGL